MKILDERTEKARKLVDAAIHFIFPGTMRSYGGRPGEVIEFMKRRDPDRFKELTAEDFSDVRKDDIELHTKPFPSEEDKLKEKFKKKCGDKF